MAVTQFLVVLAASSPTCLIFDCSFALYTSADGVRSGEGGLDDSGGSILGFLARTGGCTRGTRCRLCAF